MIGYYYIIKYYKMFNISYKLDQHKLYNMKTQSHDSVCDTNLTIFFKYNNIISIGFSINLSSVITNFNVYDWTKLIDDSSTEYTFHSQFSNMGMGNYIRISNISNNIQFIIKNNVGGNVILNIPIDVCKEEFYKFDNIYKNKIIPKL